MPTEAVPTRSLRRVHPLLPVLLIYLGLGVLIFGIGRSVPAARQFLWGIGVAASPQGLEQLLGRGEPSAVPDQEDPVRVLILGLVAMAMALSLALPAAIVFAATRSKRGYQQAMVQTLLILPVVVSGAIILVKNSVALAFSLGGVVGAVSFRNRLRDPKDAVYIFLVIVIGLACGVQVYAVGYAMSLFFNVVILGLWYSDFARVPAHLTAGMGRRRIDLARELAPQPGRGGGSGAAGRFVSVLDQQVLRSMTPEQLTALADRALEHRQRMTRDVLEADFDGAIRVTVPAEAVGAVREAVEAVLSQDAKDWRMDEPAGPASGLVTLRYEVRFRKRVPRPLLLEAVRRAAIPHAEQVTFE